MTRDPNRSIREQVVRRTWVVACDASRARIFQVGPRRDKWQLVRELEHPAGRAKGRDLLTDAPGRTKQSGSPTRPAMDPTTEPHEVESERFARSLAGILESGLAENGYQQLVLIAPPHFLGLLRAALPQNVAKHVERTLDKDYTALAARDLAERVAL
jgi:protein required for attachment to host cells